MCTLIVLYKQLEDYPIITAMNRDELIDRTASVPRLMSENPRVVAAMDLEAGGTWLGTNEYGLVVALLNRVSEKPGAVPEQPRSRGLLCLDALKRSTAGTVEEYVREESRKGIYDKFSLHYFAETGAGVIHYDSPSAVEFQAIEPGRHVFANYAPGENPAEDGLKKLKERSEKKRENAKGLLEDLPVKSIQDVCNGLITILKNSELGICILEEEGNFGTTSGSIIARAHRSGQSIYKFAHGSSRGTDFQDYSFLINAGRTG